MDVGTVKARPLLRMARMSGLPPAMLHDNCLVKLEKPERLTASKKLYIPDNAKREDFELFQGVVLAVGPGRKRKDGTLNPNEVQVGDRILAYWASMIMAPTEYGKDCYIIGEWSIQMRWPGELNLAEAFGSEIECICGKSSKGRLTVVCPKHDRHD